MTIEDEPDLSLDELCEACQITPDFIIELIEYGSIEPKGVSVESWRFDMQQLRRIRQVLRLQHDLEVNLAGAILAIDLMDRIEELQTQVELLKKHFHSR